MTPEETAQTLGHIDEHLSDPWVLGQGTFINDCEILRDIVDSLQKTIAEQAAEIERLKQELKFAMQPNAGDGL